MAGTPEITLARGGQRIALVYPTYQQAHDDFDKLVDLADDAPTVNRASGRLLIGFEGGGFLRLVGNAEQLRDNNYDQVLVDPDAWTEENAPLLAAAVATTGGVLRVGESAAIITCAECGQQLAVEGLWSIEHNEDGSHTATPGTEPTA